MQKDHQARESETDPGKDRGRRFSARSARSVAVGAGSVAAHTRHGRAFVEGAAEPHHAGEIRSCREARARHAEENRKKKRPGKLKAEEVCVLFFFRSTQYRRTKCIHDTYRLSLLFVVNNQSTTSIYVCCVPLHRAVITNNSSAEGFAE